MPEHFPSDHTSWVLSRTPAQGRGGMVASKNPLATQAGIDILNKGGNAIDAAVATAFAISVLEPWMNGLGGGGYLVGWLEAEQKPFTIDFPMRAPAGATEDMFPLVPGVDPDSGLFGWPRVVGNANIMGPQSVAIPGTVDGLALALQSYGTMSLAQVMESAIALAEDGIPVDWHYTYWIGREQANLARFAGSAAMFLTESGTAPVTIDASNPLRLQFADQARTLKGIAEQGPRWFYEGELADTFADYLSELGTPISATDFHGYHAWESEAIEVAYRDASVFVAPGPGGGFCLAQMLKLMQRIGLESRDRYDVDAWHRMVQAYRRVFADRFTYIGDPDFVDVPFETLLSDSYLDEVAQEVNSDAFRKPKAGSRERLGVSHTLQASVQDYMRDGSTTHLSVVDGSGNAVSITQTLLSGWGSRIVVPGTGVLFNNGMMWFDPEPGRPNSVAGGKRMMSNMAPAVFRQKNGAVTSLGSSGGRKIMMCNAQLIRAMVDFGDSPQDAIAAPRLDTSTQALVLPKRLNPTMVQELEALGHAVTIRDEAQLGGDFASPVAVSRTPDGTFLGGADPYYFPANARAAQN